MSVDKLSKARADKTGDCRHLSVEDCLELALEEARSGKWDKCMLLFHRPDDGHYYVDFRVAGCLGLEARGLLFTAVKEEILD